MRRKAVANHLAANVGFAARTSRAWNRPILVFVEVTNRCNLKCIMCGRTHDPRYEVKGHTGDVSLELVQRLDPILHLAKTVNLVGVGEPTMNRHFADIVHHVKSFGPYLSTTCNATLLTDDIAGRLIGCGLDQIVFSVDGCTAPTFEAIRVGANFDRVTANIRKFTAMKREMGKRKPLVAIELVLMNANAEELPMLPRFAKDLGADQLIVVPMFEHSGEEFSPIINQQSLRRVPLERGEALWMRFHEELAATGMPLSTTMEGRMAEVFGDGAPETTSGARSIESVSVKPGTPYCTQPWSVIYLSWKGDIRTCCFTDLAFGSLNDQDIESIWNGPKYRAFRSQVARGELHPACTDCVARGSNYDVLRLSAGFIAKKALEKTLETVGLKSAAASN